jgi:hypothetical protein
MGPDDNLYHTQAQVIPPVNLVLRMRWVEPVLHL